MARRRRRIATEINIKHSSLFAFILLNLLITSVASYHQHNQQHHQYQQHNLHHHHHHHHNNHHLTSANYDQRHDLFADQPDYDNPKSLKSHYTASSQQQQQQQQVPSTAAHLCSFLPQQVAKHVKLCKLIAHSPSADEAVTLGASRGLAECRNQFKSDRWNCTHSHGDHHLLTGELTQSVGNRESGFLHAIAAAGIVHSIATACSVGNLTDCTCDKTRFGFGHRSDELGTAWKWGGCSNNIRHGMSFAKHLVELLDAVHMHSLTMRHNNKAGSHHLVSRNLIDPSHRIGKRSLSSKSRDPNQVRARLLTGAITPADRFEFAAAAAAAALVQPQAPPSYCQRNHNISQAAHLELIKSLLSKNSLERHQEIRLAMNMHNNKVGRMAVAKNMEFRCRCHGLSGTCSLKTCWLTLPDFQVIGDYLRKKYEASVHLPTIVNVNKLIPMMDRNELSAILSGSQQVGPQQQQQPSPLGYSNLIQTTATTPTAAMSPMTSTTNSPPIDHEQGQVDQVVLASTSKVSRSEPQVTDMEQLMADAPSPARMQLSGHFIPVTPVGPSSTQSPTHYNFYYERHKQLQQIGQFPPPTSTTTAGTGDKLKLRELNSGADMMHDLSNIAPMSQQQYQALLRDMKLCNNITTTITSHLTTRDLSHHQAEGHQMSSNQDGQTGKQQQLQRKLISQQHSPPPLASQQHLIKSANQQLSQLLHSNKDDLVHLHKSPDYCEADLKHGFPGVQSRVCNDDPLAPDNCDKLCCGRGFTTRVYQHSYKCDCKFQYCCSINCLVCEKEIKSVVCN